LPAGERLPALVTPVLALSPDGARMAFISAQSGGQQIYLRSIDKAEVTAVPGSVGASELSFSPDGRWLAFTAGGRLMKVSMDGGAPLTICSASNTRGLSWGDDDTIVFAANFGTGGLFRVASGGGTPQALTSTLKGAESPEAAHRWPQMLPGAKAIMFTAWARNIDDAQIVVHRFDSNERRVVVRGGTYARYVPPGHLVYVRAGTLFGVRFDVSRLETIGDSVPLAEGVVLTAEGAAQYDVASTGSLVHVPGGLQGSGRQLTWVDRSGKEDPVGAPPRAYLSPRISPDGQQIATVIQGTNDDVWTYDIPRQTLTRLTFESTSLSPVWTPDGKRVIFRSTRNGTLNLFARAADGSGAEERLMVNDANQTPSDVSPEGRVMAFNEAGDVWILPLVGDKLPSAFVKTPFFESDGVFRQTAAG
jgi:serine/threonine-protein kinase